MGVVGWWGEAPYAPDHKVVESRTIGDSVARACILGGLLIVYQDGLLGQRQSVLRGGRGGSDVSTVPSTQHQPFAFRFSLSEEKGGVKRLWFAGRD